MKKRNFVTSKDKKDWIDFIKHMGEIIPKDKDFTNISVNKKKVTKLDLHGFSLVEANKEVKKFIINSFKKGYKKILVVTGKGSRSKLKNNPYVSDKLGVLKYSIPEFIKNDEKLNVMINKISQADLIDGGEGAIYIFLKNNKK